MPPKQSSTAYTPYQSSTRVNVLLSFAASTTYNPRGLECRYYPCYVTAFQELFHTVSDDLYASTQVAISIPGEVVKQVTQEKNHKHEGERLRHERSLIETTPGPVEPTNSQRTSIRILDKFLNIQHQRRATLVTEERAWQEKESRCNAGPEDPPRGKHVVTIL